MGSTSYLNLFTYNVSDDGDIGFDELRANINGSGSSSNMKIFDAFAGQLLMDVPTLISGYSSSNVIISASVSSASAQVEASGSQIEDASTRFEIIDTFSGAGQADFTGISQDYSHLLIMGNVGVNNSEYITDVGIDFNGDTTLSRYNLTYWGASGSETDNSANIELIGKFSTGYGIIGKSSGSNNSHYGGTVFGVIPNYSASTVFYKSCLGKSSIVQDSGSLCSYNVGSVWKMHDPITRIRIFGVNVSGSRCDFIDGSELSLYAIE